MRIESGVSLREFNTFGLPAQARCPCACAARPTCARSSTIPESATPKFILGGGSNIVLTRDMAELVVKVELRGMRLVEARDDAFIVEAGAGESWHEVVAWTLAQGWPGLENLALIRARWAPRRCRTSAPGAELPSASSRCRRST